MGDMERVKERVKDLRDERDAALITGAGAGMLALLVGLMTLFVAFAPGS
jgi:hypothetical protein